MSRTLLRIIIHFGAFMAPADLDLLAGEAFAWAAQRAHLMPTPRHVDPANKYVIRSGLQKAVRRGKGSEAVELALALHRLDPANCWRGILTIALEDVGFGCPDAVLWATAGQSSIFRRRVGELPLLIALTLEMSRSLKSRAACDLSFIVDTSEPAAFKFFGQMQRQQLLDYVEADDPYEAYLALSVLRGVTPSGLRTRAHDPDGVLQACEIIHDQLPRDAARAVSTAVLRPLDNMAVASFPAWRAAQNEGRVEVIEDVFPESRQLGGFASQAFDQHERLGRRAIRLFSGTLKQDHSLLRRLPAPAAYAAVADGVFLEEGQCLDRWAGGGTLTRLRQEADGYSLSRRGLYGAEADELRKIVRDNISVLNDHRAELVELSVSER